MSYRYQATKTFWENFYSLPSSQKESARLAWRIFKTRPIRSTPANAQDSSAFFPPAADGVCSGSGRRFASRVLPGGRHRHVIQHWNARHLQTIISVTGLRRFATPPGIAHSLPACRWKSESIPVIGKSPLAARSRPAFATQRRRAHRHRL
jgi:hypothetical protein